MVLANILQGLSGTLNNVFIGQMLGTHALAAVSGMFPIIFFFISLVIGIGAGASVLIGQAWGARETHKVKQIAGTALALGLILGLLVAVFGGTFAEELLRILGTPADLLDDAILYARTMMLMMPLLLVFILLTQLMRGVGDTLLPLYSLIISTAVSCVMTPAFIRGWFGLPQLGVTSAAAASFVSFVAALSWLAWYMRRKKHPIAPDGELLRALRINGPILKLVVKIGLPTGVQMIVISLAEIVLLSLVNGFGSNATAAYGAVNQVVNYAQFPALSIAITASILGAQAIGAGNSGQLRAIARTGLKLNLIITGSIVLVGYLFSRQFIGLFITSAPVVELAQVLLHIMLWSIVIFGFQAVLGGVMRASGSVLVPTGIAIFCIAAIEVPSALLLSRLFGINGVWASYPITFVSMLVLQASYYQFVWRKKKVERLV
ncbi:MAG: MATE family efflux transporter [Burkholderiales bacterium]|nr:MAG: MATE family efflux transporter [Burkholderiales bacterium]